ncbi:MAG: hypothetical protein IT444_06420 [Phycisphaeraceae bacterium]|nr:hypothetical protein [Phycisphaeraceae bacterium]
MRNAIVISVLSLLLLGCNRGLQYKPEAPIPQARISADYSLLKDQVQVQVDTDGYHLQSAEIITPEGTAIRPVNIYHPPVKGGKSTGIGVGVGSGGLGTGVSVGASTGSSHVEGLSTATFDSKEIGSPPWHLRVKLVSLPAVDITLPAR